MRLALPVLAALTLAACASSGAQSRYSQDYTQLREDCAARQGILTPITGAMTGRPQTDNACEIRGASGRLNGDHARSD